MFFKDEMTKIEESGVKNNLTGNPTKQHRLCSKHIIWWTSSFRPSLETSLDVSVGCCHN